jgi:hypothetical protein
MDCDVLGISPLISILPLYFCTNHFRVVSFCVGKNTIPVIQYPDNTIKVQTGACKKNFFFFHSIIISNQPYIHSDSIINTISTTSRYLSV